MSVTALPTRRNLKKLSLRAAIALSHRATQRVTKLLPPSFTTTESTPKSSDERVFSIGCLLVKSFCDGDLNREATRLTEIMEDNKWDMKDESSYGPDDLVLKSGSYTFEAVIQARFGHAVEEGILTSKTAQKVIDSVYKSLTAASAASIAAGDQFRLSFLKAVSKDYEILLSRNTALFPEYGPSIDTTNEGPLGALWHGITPRVTTVAGLENSNPDLHGPDVSQPPPSAADVISDTHDETPPEGYLYKYVKYKDLLKVLENSTLKFSSFKCFNDPYDGQLLPIKKFGWTRFFSALRDETMRLAASENESIYQLPTDIPTDDVISAAAKIVMDSINQKDGSYAFSLAQAENAEKIELLCKLLRPMIFLAQQGKLGAKNDAASFLGEFLDLFKRHRLPLSIQDTERRQTAALADMIQVLCLSEVPDSLLMWSHYSDHHKGAVLKFDTCSTNSGYFADARDVEYEKELPSIEQPLGLARRYLGVDKFDTEKWKSRQFYTKSNEWRYEKEWRVMATNKMQEHGPFLPFHKNSLVSIFLGCRVETEKIQDILDLVIDKQYPTDVYIAEKDEVEFALNFVPVSNGKMRSSAPPKIDTDERARLYRSCLDKYFEFWNLQGDDLIGKRRCIRSEGILADYGPADSKELFREMIQKLEATYEANAEIKKGGINEQETDEKRRLRILRPSAKAYGALEDILRADLEARGGTLPEHKEELDE